MSFTFTTIINWFLLTQRLKDKWWNLRTSADQLFLDKFSWKIRNSSLTPSLKRRRVERRPSKMNTDIICVFAILVDVCTWFCIGSYNCHIQCVVTKQRKKSKRQKIITKSDINTFSLLRWQWCPGRSSYEESWLLERADQRCWVGSRSFWACSTRPGILKQSIWREITFAVLFWVSQIGIILAAAPPIICI